MSGVRSIAAATLSMSADSATNRFEMRRRPWEEPGWLDVVARGAIDGMAPAWDGRACGTAGLGELSVTGGAGERGGLVAASGSGEGWRPVDTSPRSASCPAFSSWRAVNSPSKLSDGRDGCGAGNGGDGAVTATGAAAGKRGPALAMEPDISARSTKSPT